MRSGELLVGRGVHNESVYLVGEILLCFCYYTEGGFY